ncbi:hypothetical protein [Bacteroides sp. 519]|uniref:hypothetical protein n=1 Tax=Bacteroides sp. 519 TaxID=2302937 RepID=UPI0013D4CDBE|nr:hypothetical protein [Bacteroides sp. 519]NDV60487.1 hypothetical protein [Bacteroides sp. 519]
MSKLRKITIDGDEYLYGITTQYHKENQTSTLTIRIFLNGEKKTPLIIKFLTLDNYFLGNPLNSGVKLFHKTMNSNETININHPGLIRKFIELGIKHGWTGSNKTEVQNGIDYLEELGYNTNSITNGTTTT